MEKFKEASFLFFMLEYNYKKKTICSILKIQIAFVRQMENTSFKNSHLSKWTAYFLVLPYRYSNADL